MEEVRLMLSWEGGPDDLSRRAEKPIWMGWVGEAQRSLLLHKSSSLGTTLSPFCLVLLVGFHAVGLFLDSSTHLVEVDVWILAVDMSLVLSSH